MNIADKILIDENLRKNTELQQSGNLNKETEIETLKNFSNHYEGGIEIISSKYGDITGEVSKYQKNKKGISANLMPLKSMINSMLSFCDFKINEVIEMFLSKIKK